MLTQLKINHFAIVHQLDIELAQGLSVITGETGAGKSIAIDALSLCLGQRADSAMVCEGKERAEICASFQLSPNSPALQWLMQQELQDLDNPQECILRRIINVDGRSKSFINNTPVSTIQLKELGQFLVHINGQHASQQLLKNDYQLQLIDSFANHPSLLAEIKENYQHWHSLNNQVKNFQQRLAENNARKQLLQYQVEELEDFNLQPNEYLELEENHRNLSNTEQLIQLSQSALNLLSENEKNSIDRLLYKSIQYVDELCELNPRYGEVQNLLNEALIQVQEASNEILHLNASIDEDPDRLAQIEQRMGQAIQLARKHNVKPEDLVKFQHRLKQELTDLVDFSESEQQLIEQEQIAKKRLIATAKRLSLSRLNAANQLATQVTAEINKLAMENAKFYIEITTDESKITSNGCDSITFMLRSNLGQQPQPLAKIASGGELSRIALAIQVLTADKATVPTLIFDEVDTGISGMTATVVGKLLRQLGEKCQVLCVTHLPQVACLGHHQFSVEKSVIKQKTQTKMTKLTEKQRITAIARLLGGQQITDITLANAQEMLGAIK